MTCPLLLWLALLFPTLNCRLAVATLRAEAENTSGEPDRVTLRGPLALHPPPPQKLTYSLHPSTLAALHFEKEGARSR